MSLQITGKQDLGLTVADECQRRHGRAPSAGGGTGEGVNRAGRSDAGLR